MPDSVRPHRRQPTRLLYPWDSPGKNTGVGCHFLLQGMQVKSESEVAQSCPTLSNPMDCSPPDSSVHGIFQARVLEWGTIALSQSKFKKKRRRKERKGRNKAIRERKGKAKYHLRLDLKYNIKLPFDCNCEPWQWNGDGENAYLGGRVVILKC